MATRVIAALPEEALVSALRGRKILVVGGTAGIGKALALSCIKRGAQVTVVGRRTPGPELAAATFVSKDVSLMKSAAALADEIDVAALDTIVFTNGIMAARERQVSAEGIELDLAVSYLSRFAFARRLAEKGFGKRRADTSVKPRIFVMGFPGSPQTAMVGDLNAERSYSAMPVHMNTVVGNEALVSYLAKQLEGSANVYGLNPGFIKTEIRDNFLGKGSWLSWIIESTVGLFTWTADNYAERTLVHVLASPELENETGTLIDNVRKVLKPNPFLAKDNNLERLLAESATLADRALAAPVSAPAPK